MNKQPIETANDSDLRLSPAAMQRAARRARELALQTSTIIVISRREVIEQVGPLAAAASEDDGSQQRGAACENRP